MSISLDINTDLQRQIDSMSQGMMAVRYTSQGQPSLFYRLKKFKVEDLDPSLGSGVHPAFIVDGVERDEVLVGVHPGAESNGEAVSQAGFLPRTDVDYDESLALCRSSGPGFCMTTNAMYAALALKARSDNQFPRGNNDSGRAYNAPDEYGVDGDGNSTQGGGATKILAGSNPVTWNYPRLPWGVQSLNGNVWEWSAGMRIVDAEIQVIPDNDAVLPTVDASDSSSAWRAIDAQTGDLVAPGSTGTVRYAESGTTNATLVCGNGDRFATMQSYGIADPALHRLKQLALMQPGSPIEQDGFFIDTSGKRLPFRGGNWFLGAGAGVFALSLGNDRGNSSSGIGFRPAFVI